MEITPETIWAKRAAWAHRWELWLLIGLPFAGLILAGLLELILKAWGPLLPAVSIPVPYWDSEYSYEIDLPFLLRIVPLILLVSTYRLVNGGDRPLLALLWKYAIAVKVIGLIMLLVTTYGFVGTGNWALYLAIVTLRAVITIGLLVAFGRAASRRGFRNALLFIAATGFLDFLVFWAVVPGSSDWTYVMVLLTVVYGTALTLAAVWAVRRVDSNGTVGWNVVVIPVAALLLFLTTELAVETALEIWHLNWASDPWELELAGRDIRTIGARLITFGFTLAGYLISAGLVYLVRIRNPDASRAAPA